MSNPFAYKNFRGTTINDYMTSEVYKSERGSLDQGYIIYLCLIASITFPFFQSIALCYFFIITTQNWIMKMFNQLK